MGGPLDHASLCAFYGTLALSAFSLSGVYNDQSWLEKAKRCRQGTYEHTEKMMRTAYGIPKAAKYKTILIGLLVMFQPTTFSSLQRENEYFFVEAEKFIRLKGLVKNKSRKVRLLHHCYAFARLIYESTLIDGASLDHRLSLCDAVASSGLVIYDHDSSTFYHPKWNDLGHRNDESEESGRRRK
jgi:hypothetical protein